MSSATATGMSCALLNKEPALASGFFLCLKFDPSFKKIHQIFTLSINCLDSVIFS